MPTKSTKSAKISPKTPAASTPAVEAAATGTLSPADLDETDPQVLQQIIRKQQQEIQKLQHALEAKVAEKASALEEAQALTHLGSWQWDVATGHISWSDELYRIYGLKPQDHEVGFEEFMSMIHPADRARISNAIGTSSQTGEPFDFEHRIILPDKKERVLHGMGKVITDAKGQPLRMLGTSQDITEANRLERAKDEFISLVSHQLRTPLTIIRLYGNMLTDGIAGPLDKKQSWYVTKITTASVRLIKLVGDILNISRLELNRIKIEAKPADTSKLIQSYLEELAPIANSKGVTIRFKPQADLGLSPIDATIFGEIVHNLVGNAVRYCHDQDGEVTISLKKEKRGYLLTVTDNGIGIPKAAQAHIFERFYRAGNASNADGEGTGLGLYLVKLFTETAGGKTWFKSEVGKGTTFYVLFPPDGMVARDAS